MTIANGVSFATVTIDTSAAAVGAYVLALESFDSSENSLLGTLKTDMVTIYVIENEESTK